MCPMCSLLGKNRKPNNTHYLNLQGASLERYSKPGSSLCLWRDDLSSGMEGALLFIFFIFVGEKRKHAHLCTDTLKFLYVFKASPNTTFPHYHLRHLQRPKRTVSDRDFSKSPPHLHCCWAMTEWPQHLLSLKGIWRPRRPKEPQAIRGTGP